MAIQSGDSWKKDSLCIEYPDIDFFPNEAVKADVNRAKNICRRCLVKDECLEYAYTSDQHDGIWGGFTTREVRKVAPFHRMRVQLTTPVVISNVVPLRTSPPRFVLDIKGPKSSSLHDPLDT